MLTGRYHWRDFHGIVNSFGKSVFKAERLTLPEMLQAKGYETACIGNNVSLMQNVTLGGMPPPPPASLPAYVFAALHPF
jgi:hypothetical protein